MSGVVGKSSFGLAGKAAQELVSLDFERTAAADKFQNEHPSKSGSLVYIFKIS